MPAILNLTNEDLRDIARSAATGTKGSYSRIDYSGFAEVGTMADMTDDIVDCDILALDPAKDDAGDEKAVKARNKNRLRVLGNVKRNLRIALDNDKAEVSQFWATIPAPTKDNDKATKRAYCVKRTK